MHVIAPKNLFDHLKKNEVAQRIQRDLVICYSQQVPLSAVWLKAGTLRTHFDRRTPIDYTEPGLYLMEPFSASKTLGYSVKVLPGSEVWLVTKSVLQEFLQYA